ncbi:hypothetical protein [Mesorhizobium sp. SP-1A]|uniref:hypothetical protein n=1 Tax=Mesorhizobium sp. SP-1A TaxID=3077840 RepID=UPI0028F6FC51|nr:hypothetical protein [Mesorhizobium sp. SP-1A]
MENDGVMKCRCRGSNSDCFHCFGTGIIATAEPVDVSSFDVKRSTATPSTSILDPKFAQRSNKMSMEQAIISHGTLNGDQATPQRFADAVCAIKAFREADPAHIGPHADALLDTIKGALKFAKPKFRKFMNNMHSISTRQGVPSREKAKLLTVRSALLQGSLKFTAAQISVLDEAFRLASKGPAAYEDKTFRIQLIALKDRLKTLEPKPAEPAPPTVPVGKAGLVLVSPDNYLSEGQTSQFLERLKDRKIDHVYFIGTDDGFDNFKAKFSHVSTLHLKTEAELKAVMSSSSVCTLRLQSENSDLKLAI